MAETPWNLLEQVDTLTDVFIGKLNFKSPLFWIPLTVIAIGLSAISYSYYSPKRHLFVCVGELEITSSEKITEQRNRKTRFTEEFIKVYEYAWGLGYSLDHFPREECGFVLDKSIVVCSIGEFETPSYSYAEFNLDEGIYTYEWTRVDNQETIIYRGSDLTCKKTMRAINK